jgi:hypothetical protein
LCTSEQRKRHTKHSIKNEYISLKKHSKSYIVRTRTFRLSIFDNVLECPKRNQSVE